jgi:hypothetical protein
MEIKRLILSDEVNNFKENFKKDLESSIVMPEEKSVPKYYVYGFVVKFFLTNQQAIIDMIAESRCSSASIQTLFWLLKEELNVWLFEDKLKEIENKLEELDTPMFNLSIVTSIKETFIEYAKKVSNDVKMEYYSKR